MQPCPYGTSSVHVRLRVTRNDHSKKKKKCGGGVINRTKKKAFCGGGTLHNHFSASVWIICGPFRTGRERESERFSSHFIFYISGTRAKRDEHRTTSPPHTRACIACYHSNVVIILGPHSFPSNECKSTPSPLASDGSWQEDVVALNLGCTFKTALSWFAPSHRCAIQPRWLIFNWASEAEPRGGTLAGEGQMQAVPQSRERRGSATVCIEGGGGSSWISAPPPPRRKCCGG